MSRQESGHGERGIERRMRCDKGEGACQGRGGGMGRGS